MITEEQIKNLKPGDPLIIHGTFVRRAADDDIVVCVKMTDTPDKIINAYKYIHRSCIFLPQKNAEHDPYRKFKKGDIVRLVERDGRRPASYKPILLGHTYTVYADEDDGEVILDIGLGTEGGEAIEWYYLELITPVEDTFPYYIVEKDIEFQVRMKVEDKDCLISTFRFKNIVEGYKQYSNMLPSMKQAREAAEAECERLNEKYRKEHK